MNRQGILPSPPVGVDARLSLLKLLAAFAVVLVHTTMVRVSQVDVHSVGWWFSNVGDAAGRILLSGGGARDLGRIVAP